jgi:hypothetical protein
LEGGLYSLAVEGADVVIDAGGVYFHDINTSA